MPNKLNLKTAILGLLIGLLALAQMGDQIARIQVQANTPASVMSVAADLPEGTEEVGTDSQGEGGGGSPGTGGNVDPTPTPTGPSGSQGEGGGG